MVVGSSCCEANGLKPFRLLLYCRRRMTADPYDPDILGYICATVFLIKAK